MAHHTMISLLIVGLIFVANLHVSEAQIGVVYGTKGDNLPTPQEVVALIESNNITQVRLLEPNKDILTALKGKNIDVFLGVPNTNLTRVHNSSVAENWVAVNVKPYVPGVKIKYIVVGNHVSANSGKLVAAIFGADFMKKMQTALRNQGFKDIKVTTSCDFSMFQQPQGNPVPSAGVLLDLSNKFLTSPFINRSDKGVLPFLAESGTPFLVNLYPGFELILHPNKIKPEFALFNASGNVVTDGKLGYQNLFDAQLDTFYAILEKLGFLDMEIIIGETGWSSAGGAHANLANAKTYVTNLIQHAKKGTPKRPNKPIQVFFDLFDEDQIGVAEIDKHLGLFTADGKIKFPVSFNSSA